MEVAAPHDRASAHALTPMLCLAMPMPIAYPPSRPAVRSHPLENADFYADPRVYDVLHTHATRRDVGVLQRLQARLAPCRGRPTWLEPACGTARYLRVAAGRGIRVIGFDISPAMIEYARPLVARAAARSGRRPRDARLFVARMERFADHIPPGSVDLAFNLINTIRHLETDRAMRAHLREVARVLKPRGVYIVGLSVTRPGLEDVTEDIWRATRGSTRVHQVVQYLPPATHTDRFETVISQVVVVTPRGERHIASRYRLRTYSLAQWRSCVRSSGLEVAHWTDDSGRPTEPVEPGYALCILRPARR